MGDVSPFSGFTGFMIQNLGNTTQRWVIRRAQGDPALRLICFCYAGGNPAFFLPWQQELGPDVEVLAIQLPGRGARFGEPLVDDAVIAAEAICEAILPLLDRPYVLFGHSLGALLAFEVCHALRACHAPLPDALVVSGAQSPRLRAPKRKLHLLNDAELIRELARYGGTPPEILQHAELLALVLPIVRTDFRMAVEYRHTPRPPLPVPISVFAGRDDEFDSPAQYEDWLHETSAGGTLHWFDGGHFFINSATGQVLAQLRAILDRCHGRQTRHQPVLQGRE
jgi:medium-chain acyl-[acyl-carrier-protein] hydrolase